MVTSFGVSIFTPRVLKLIWAEQLLVKRTAAGIALKHIFLAEPNALELRLAARRLKLPLRLRERAIWGQRLIHYYANEKEHTQKQS